MNQGTGNEYRFFRLNPRRVLKPRRGIPPPQDDPVALRFEPLTETETGRCLLPRPAFDRLGRSENPKRSFADRRAEIEDPVLLARRDDVNRSSPRVARLDPFRSARPRVPACASMMSTQGSPVSQ